MRNRIFFDLQFSGISRISPAPTSLFPFFPLKDASYTLQTPRRHSRWVSYPLHSSLTLLQAVSFNSTTFASSPSFLPLHSYNESHGSFSHHHDPCLTTRRSLVPLLHLSQLLQLGGACWSPNRIVPQRDGVPRRGRLGSVLACMCQLEKSGSGLLKVMDRIG